MIPLSLKFTSTRERLAELYHNDLLAYSQALLETHCRDLGFQMVESPRSKPGLGEVAKAE